MRRRGLVAGAAIAHHRDDQMQQQYQQGAYDQQSAGQAYAAPPPAPAPAYEPAPAPAPAPAPDPWDTKMDELKRLGDLHDQGILTDEEFAAQKQKILDS